MKITYIKGEGTYPESVSITLKRDGATITEKTSVDRLLITKHIYNAQKKELVSMSDKEMLTILEFVRTKRSKHINRATKKSMASWRESGLNHFEDYFRPGDIVTDDVIEHYINIYPPLAMRSDFVQAGEPYNCERNYDTGSFQSTYITFSRYQGNWWFSGFCFVNETVNRVVDYDRLAKRIDELEQAIKNTTEEHLKEVKTPCKKAVLFDMFYLTCPFFDGTVDVNNGYGCNHPLQEETEFDESSKKEQGKCYCWSCPLGVTADEESVTDADVDWSDINDNRNDIEISGNEHEYLIVDCSKDATDDEKRAYAAYARLVDI